MSRITFFLVIFDGVFASREELKAKHKLSQIVRTKPSPEFSDAVGKTVFVCFETSMGKTAGGVSPRWY